MHLTLKPGGDAARDPASWAVLPGLCCQAAGGQAAWADPVAACWLLFYAAAHLMDSLEDQDVPDPWWENLGPGAALNAATGLFFSANLALLELDNLPIPPETRQRVSREVLRPFVQMSSGQYADYLHPPQRLEEYWQIAAAKSGVFFALACRSGAALTGCSPEKLDGYEQFGLNFGLMVQILDDLGDYKDLYKHGLPADRRSLIHSIPAIYLREVCEPQVWGEFNRLLSDEAPGTAVAGQIAALIESNGGVLYLLTELNMRSHRALQGLELAGAASPARDQLAALVEDLSLPMP